MMGSGKRLEGQQKEKQMKEKMLVELFEHISKIRDTLSTISTANMNFNNQPEANINKSFREWVFIYDECQNFIVQFSYGYDVMVM